MVILFLTGRTSMCKLENRGCNDRPLHILAEKFGSLVCTRMCATSTIKFLYEKILEAIGWKDVELFGIASSILI